MAAGVMGLPLTNVAGLLVSAIGGGDGGPPEDLEQALRESIGDEDLANLLPRGPLWFMGLDSKLAQDKVFSVTPYTEWPLSREGVEKLAAGAMEPGMSTLEKFAGGIESMRQGDYYRGLEAMLSSGLAGLVKAGAADEPGLRAQKWRRARPARRPAGHRRRPLGAGTARA